MARDRLAARKANQAGGEGGGSGSWDNMAQTSAPAQTSYPPTQQQQQQQPYGSSSYGQQEPSYGAPAHSSGDYNVGSGAQQQYTPVPGMAGGYSAQGQAQGQGQQQQQQQQAAYGQQGQEKAAYGGQQDPYAVGAAAGNGTGLTDFWTELSTTNSALNEMQDAIHQVRQAHAASLSRLDTGPNSAAQRETDELIDSTRRLTAANKTRIQKLNKLAKDKAQKQQVQAAKSRFMGLLQDYQTVEKEFRKKVRERGERQYKIVKPDATAEEVDQVLETENPQIFSQALLSSNRYGDARGALREIQERNQDIKKIEKTLTELAQMFNEMSMLVEQQDETIGVIETQAAGVHTDMEQGLKHTEQAVVKARKARRKKWICFWISILILVIVAAIIVGVICGGQNKCGSK